MRCRVRSDVGNINSDSDDDNNDVMKHDTPLKKQVHHHHHPHPIIALDKTFSRKLFMGEKTDSGDNTWLRSLFMLLELSGHGIPWLSLAIIPFVLVKPLHEHQSFHYFMLILIVGLLFDLVVVGSLKFIVRRPRPNYNAGDMFATVSVDKFSFPSGHTTRVAFLASFYTYFSCNPPTHHYLIPLFPTYSLWAVLATSSWALCVALSRIMLGRHYIIDVIVGMLVGCLQFFILINFFGITPEYATIIRAAIPLSTL